MLQQLTAHVQGAIGPTRPAIDPRSSAGRCVLKEYATAHIRNVALVAHHGVGKTSLAEAFAYNARATTRLGRIAEGNTLLDHAPDEIERQITISLGLAQLEWAGHKINLLDTPG